MLLSINDEIRLRFPRQFTAVFGPVRIARLRGESPAVDALRARCESRRETWSTTLPSEIVHWRSLFAEMGAKSGTRASVDTLFRRFLRDGTLPVIHPLVDLYNWLSLANLAPMAAYDADMLAPNLSLRPGGAGEPFEPLASPGTNEPVTASEIVYADDQGVVCRYWNWRDCHRTRVRADTTNVVFFADLTADYAVAAEQAARTIARSLENGIGTSINIEVIR